MGPELGYVPLSVRHGNRRKRFGWRIQIRREALALRLAPWLRGPKPIEHSYSGRGFAHWPAVSSNYGATVSVYESSAALGPHIWLSIAGESHLESEPRPHGGVDHGIANGRTAAHLTPRQAQEIRDNLDASIRYLLERWGAT